MPRVVAIGECMIELAPDGRGGYRLGYAGDTLNSAIYMARLGVDVHFATALGDDRHSGAALAMMASEGVGTQLVSRMASRSPGLYIVENDPSGERLFSYWRDRAPIRDLFTVCQPDWIAALASSAAIYLSGITLAVLGAAGRATLAQWLAAARRGGTMVVFDVNYRPSLWGSAKRARAAFEPIMAEATMISASTEDVSALWPEDDIVTVWAADKIEVIERRPSREAVIHAGGQKFAVAGLSVAAIDTTGAGDSFNAAYLAARLDGVCPAEAARAGHIMAAAVVQSRGAVLPLRAMPRLAFGSRAA